jgi:hypothetical protein
MNNEQNSLKPKLNGDDIIRRPGAGAAEKDPVFWRAYCVRNAKRKAVNEDGAPADDVSSQGKKKPRVNIGEQRSPDSPRPW